MLKHIKRVLLIVGCAFGVWRGATDEITARRERAPAEVDVAYFTRDYRGQHWLAVSGYYDTDRAVLRPVKTAADGSAARVDLWVPLVAESDKPGDPVHVFVLLGTFTEYVAGSQLKSLADRAVTVTGTQIFFDAGALFPGVPRSLPFVMIAAGSEPGKPGIGLAFAAICGVVLVLAVWLELRSLRRHPDERREEN
jgi:hypothetical protein